MVNKPSTTPRRVSYKGPFHAVLREAIAERALTLRAVQRRLAGLDVHVSVGTLSYWQSGARTPQRGNSRRAIAALEKVLELPNGMLAALLTAKSSPSVNHSQHPDQPDQTVQQPQSWDEFIPAAPAMRALLAQFGAEVQDCLATVSLHQIAHIGEGRELARCDITETVVAREPVDRYVFAFQTDPDADVSDVTIAAAGNCRLGRMRNDRETGMVAAELLFDRLLLPGDAYLIHYAYAHPATGGFRDIHRILRSGADIYALSVAFHPSALPVHCFRFSTADRDGSQDRSAKLFLGPHNTVHIAERSVQPGVYGITWDWL
ncbi:hypothetical protein ABIA31_008502 [Catenulispora sp. MAP5-51]|uniref:hypothetical protein n=1 Tax=Catenulispora sp. MAP5-51 TaxID=3156298 RepID=UPI0035166CF0